MTTTPSKKAKPWPEAGALNGSWPANTNQGRAMTCVAFLKAHGFLTEAQAAHLRGQVEERGVES